MYGEAGFQDRVEAGRRLAGHLRDYAGRDDVIVLGLPRGGVPVAAEVARALGAPLDVFLVRKLGLPGQEEFAMGAIASGGVRVLNEELLSQLPIAEETIARVAVREQEELQRRERAYRGNRAEPRIRGRTVILVDDGLATGSTMRAAVAALRQRGPAAIVVAVPVAARETCERLGSEADEVVCPVTPDPFVAVGAWYADFSQVSDAEVRELLEREARRSHAGSSDEYAAR
jgi:putative phosphoribosyl transferase